MDESSYSNDNIKDLENSQPTTIEQQHSIMEPAKETQKEETDTTVLEKLKEPTATSSPTQTERTERKELDEKKRQVKNVKSMIFFDLMSYKIGVYEII